MQRSRHCSLAPTLLKLAALYLGLRQVCGNPSGVATPLSAWQSGIASLYGVQGDAYAPSMGAIIGSCGYGLIDRLSYPYWSIGALAPSNNFYVQGPVEACGMCFQMQCINNGPQFAGKCNDNWQTNSITFMVTDTCPECQQNQVDLNALAFQNLAPMANGRIAMQYRRVTCTPQEPVTVRVDSNRGSGGWMRLWVLNTAGTAGVTGVSIRSAGSSGPWVPMTNVFGADWEISASPVQPLDMLVTSDDGSSLEIPTGVLTDYIGLGVAPSNFGQDPTAAVAGLVAAGAGGVNVPVDAGSTSISVSG